MVVKARSFTLNTRRIEMDREEVIQKWTGPEGVELVYPQGQDQLGRSVERILRYLCQDPICEIGCGTGRVAKIFDAYEYIGVDINPDALKIARRENKRFNASFVLAEWDDPFPEAKTYLFYTVLLHIPDDEIEGVIKRIKGRAIVAEPMNRWIREYGLSNNFQRDPGDYRAMFEKYGMMEKEFFHVHLPYFPYYIHVIKYESV